MKLQLDTTAKVIRLEVSANLKELFNLLNKILPNKEWEEYKLETNTIIQNWTSPIVITPYIPPQSYPWWNPNPIIYGTTIQSPELQPETFGGIESQPLNQRVYNLEVQL